MAAVTKDMSFLSNGKKKREDRGGADVAELDGLTVYANAIASGEQLEAYDLDGHRHLLAEIRDLRWIIKRTNRRFDCFGFVLKILLSRLDHLSEQYHENYVERQLIWKDELDYWDDDDGFYNFANLIFEIRSWLNWLDLLQKKKAKGFL